MKRTLYKALSMLLTAAMVLNMGLTPVFAEGVPLGASGLTECHTAHDSECGYTETIKIGGCTHEHGGDCGYTEGTAEQPCTFIAEEDAQASPADADEHEHDEACGYAPATEGTPCTHEHDDTCGYGETITVTPCTHTCEVCEGLDSGKPQEKVCTCPPVDSGEPVHGEDCPLYTAPEQSEAVKALIALVDALPNADALTEENKEATKPAYETAVMAYEVLPDEDKAVFEATSQYTKLMTLRDVLFGIAQMTNESTWNISSGDLTLDSNCGAGTCAGHIVSGNTITNRILIQSGTHNITLNDTSIDVSGTKNACAFEIADGATVNLTLEHDNTLKSGSYKAGLQASTGATLVITDTSTGSLTATGGSAGSDGGVYKGSGAGIGGGDGLGGGTIDINGGTVNAIGGNGYDSAPAGGGGAGIGGGAGLSSGGNGGTVDISGGTVNATGNAGGAGIGGGNVILSKGNGGAGGTIDISNGIVNATGNAGGAGIGGADEGGSGGTTDISGGTVTATGGNEGGAGIGGGNKGAVGTITIKDGTVNATGGGGAGIGNGNGGAGGTITIKNGTVNATGGYVSAGIGSYKSIANRIDANSTIDISGGMVTATGGELGPGIGSGGPGVGSGGIIDISGGTVFATGGNNGAGIGGGNDSVGNTITIQGGIITATGGNDAAGIGGGNGYDTDGGTINISGNTVVFATSPNTNHIGGGKLGHDGIVNRIGGIIFEGTNGELHAANITPTASFTIPSTHTLAIKSGKNLTISTAITVSNNGAILNEGTITNNGTLDGTGHYTGEGDVSLTKSMVTPPKNLSYNGSPKVISVKVFDHTFTENTDYTVAYSPNNINVGEVVATITTVSGGKLTGSAITGDPFIITQSDTTFTGGIKTYKDVAEQSTFTYGETITVTVTPEATGTAPVVKGRAALTPPAANEMALFVGSKQITAPQTVTSGTELTFSIDTTGKLLSIGSNTITAKYVGSESMAGHEESVTVTLNKKTLNATVATDTTKVYDGNANFTNVALTIGTGEILSGDTVSASANLAAKNATVGENKELVATDITLIGEGADWYSLTPGYITGNLSITPATPSVKVIAEKKAMSLLRSIIGNHNDTITLTATTKGENGEKPNGSVVFKNGAQELATKTTTDGVATYEWENPPASNYIITAEFTASDSETNYVKTAVTGAYTFDIDKAVQKNFAITPVNGKTYGDGTFALATTGGSGTGMTVTYVSSNTNVLTIVGDRATIVGAGDATVTATKEGDTNYNEATATYKITIVQATPTVAWDSTEQTLTYTGTAIEESALTKPTVTGIAAGDTSNGTISYAYKKVDDFLFGLFEGYTDGLPKDAGKYEIKAQIAATGNYDKADSTNVLKLTIEQRSSTLTINSYTGKTYDGNAVTDPTNITSNVTTPTVNYTYYLTDGTTKTTAENSGASGTGKAPVNAGGYKVTGTIEETPNITTVTSAAVDFTIAQKELTVTGGTVTPKKWDGNANATVTDLTFSTMASGETLEINNDYTVGTPIFDSASVGDSKTVTGIAVLVDNAKTKNYSLNGIFVDVKGDIILADGPAAPTNGVVNDTKGVDNFTFNPVNGITEANKYEYSTNGGIDWTDATANPISIGNIAVPVGTLQVRVKATPTHKEGAILSNDTAFTASIEGSVSIDGTATYGEMLTANATGAQTDAVLSYKWKTTDGIIGTDSATLAIPGAAVDKTITVEVTAAGYNGKLDATTATVAKKAVTATAGTISKVYDGTNAVEAADQALLIAKANSSDDITVTMPNATYNDATVNANKAITVGTLTIAGTAASWYDVTAPSSVTGDITVKPLTSATVTVNGTYTYTGAVQSPTTANVVVKDGVTTLIGGTDYTFTASNNINAGDATVNVTFMGNYSGTASGSFPIGKASLTITGYTTDGKNYDGTTDATVSAVLFDGTVSGESLTPATDYTASAQFVSKDVGSAVEVTGTVTLVNSTTAKNYRLLDGTLSGQSAQIKAIDPTYSVANQNIKIGKKLDDIQAATSATGVNGETVDGTPKWSETDGGNALTDYTFTGAAGGTMTLYWTFTPEIGGNYKDLSGSTTFTLTEKEVPTLTVSNIEKNYDGKEVTAVTGTAKVGETTVAGAFAFDRAPIMQNASTYNVTVKFTPADIGNYGIATTNITVTIKKVALIVKAEDKNILVGAAKPVYTATTTGLVNNETISGVTFTPENPDTSAKGTFTITPTGGTISGGGNGNYDITYQTGILNINVDVSAINAAIAAANSAKSDITTSDQPVSSVANGTKFVTPAEMQALTDAIDTATAAKDTVSTMVQAEQAATTLNAAVDTFEAVIKIGTYSSGGSTGDGGSNSLSPSSPNQTKPENGNVNLKPSVDKDGNASVTISGKNADDAIKKAKEQAKKNGTQKNGISTTITLDTNKTLNSFKVKLPKSTQEKLIAAGVTSLTINGGATITFDLEAIKHMKATVNADVTVTATKTANSKLSKKVQTATGGRPVYDFKVTGGGKTITTFGKGKLSLTIPYELKKVDGKGKPSKKGRLENPGNLVGIYMDAKGKVTYLARSSYNAQSKTMLISTTHLSRYGVAYKTSTATFTDTVTHWAKADIQFVAARGLLDGTSATTFSPNSSMTRGMFVTALGKLAGIDTNSYKTSRFTDVAAGSYYLPYVEWAVKNNIATGTSTTTFAPDQAMTRQEMAVMTANYTKAVGYQLPSVYKEIIFTDSASIGTWERAAVKEMQMAGILMGKDGNRFDPTGTATRAEGSALLRRLVELVANSETAEGWVQNDSGNWMYFEDGKAITGKKKLDGITYEFDQYGVTDILHKDRRFTVYTVQKGDSFKAIAAKYKVNILELALFNDKTIFGPIHPGDELKIPQK